MYDRSHVVQSELRCTTGVRIYDWSHDVRPESGCTNRDEMYH
jgi:hypothetical protein